MKPLVSTLLVCGVTAILSNSCPASVIAFWDFNNGFAVPDQSPQIVHTATIGSGILYQQRGDTDGNGKGGNAFVDVANGINATAGVAMAWDDIAKSGANDAEFFLTFSTTDLSNIILSFDIRGNATIVPSFDLKYSLTDLVDVVNPPDVTGTIKDFSGGLSTTIYNNYTVNAGATFTRVTLDLSSVTALDNQSVVSLRFDDWSNGTGNNDMRIDNVLVTASPVPEPSTALLGSLGLLGLLLRRRR